MKVKRHKNLTDELICDLTLELTSILSYKSEFIRVYVMGYILDTSDTEKIQYPLRVTGRTIGTLTLSPDRIIQKISIGSDCIGLFECDYRQITDAYIGKRFEEAS